MMVQLKLQAKFDHSIQYFLHLRGNCCSAAILQLLQPRFQVYYCKLVEEHHRRWAYNHLLSEDIEPTVEYFDGCFEYLIPLPLLYEIANKLCPAM